MPSRQGPLKAIVLDPAAFREIRDIALAGYRARGRQEALGLLYGQEKQGGMLALRRAVRYRSRATHSRVDYDEYALRRRARVLAQRLGLDYLGMFHSHPDEDMIGHSYDDCERFVSDTDSLIDGVVVLWRRDRRPRLRSHTALYHYDSPNGLVFGLRLYYVDSDGYVARAKLTLGDS
ncbi:hypothetical protein JXD38_08475 [candidate division WOR-3 bacterium]|nr:hypothetical protein [candidate division WOR-3 bacterium]